MDPFARYLPALEEELRWAITSLEDGPELLYGMLRYHLGWVDAEFRPAEFNGGKRLRPIFLLLACEAQGGDWYQALPAAAAVELLHNFSLIHDDIEDQDPQRHGRPTLWTIWGEAQAINAGDALFALAYRAILSLDSVNLTPDQVLQAVNRYTNTVLQLTVGQCLDLSFENETIVDEAAYLRMISGKTAALLGLACELGGLVAGAPPAPTSALRAFGSALGMAFQIQDDLLGLWGDPERTGKPVGSDLRHRKKTLPIGHGLTRSPALQALLAQPELDDGTVQEALIHLEAAGSRTYTQSKVVEYHAEALQALARSGGTGEAQEALTALAEQLLHRVK